jgi:hypothetical protein
LDLGFIAGLDIVLLAYGWERGNAKMDGCCNGRDYHRLTISFHETIDSEKALFTQKDKRNRKRPCQDKRFFLSEVCKVYRSGI